MAIAARLGNLVPRRTLFADIDDAPGGTGATMGQRTEDFDLIDRCDGWPNSFAAGSMWTKAEGRGGLWLPCHDGCGRACVGNRYRRLASEVILGASVRVHR